MRKIDSDYYRARIVSEETAARDAADPEAARRHRQLAEHYATMIANDAAEAGRAADG